MTSNPTPDDRYMSAAEAADALGVSVQTLYVYVGRKGIRSQPISGSKLKRYWRADIERLRQKGRGAGAPSLREETDLTLITDDELYFRGRWVTQLAEHASFEDVAALLWDVEPADVFTPQTPTEPPLFSKLDRLVAGQPDVDRASILFPILEEANPRAYDLSPAGMARTGADVLRWLAALTVRVPAPSAEPIHEFIARCLERGPEVADLIRRLLVLWADHGIESSAFAVRAVASAGVTPWRAVVAGLSVSNGRRSRLDLMDAAYRFLLEIEESERPEAPVIRRLRDGEILPGFDEPLFRQGVLLYPNGDPRARALLASCAEIFRNDPAYQRFRAVLDMVADVKNLEPNNLLVGQFIYRHLGLPPRGTLFHLSRSAGWIAHAIEQGQAGEMEHGRGAYMGPLPT